MESVCVGGSSEAVLKSSVSRFGKRCSVRGEEGVGEVRRRMECRLTWPVKLFHLISY